MVIPFELLVSQLFIQLVCFKYDVYKSVCRTCGLWYVHFQVPVAVGGVTKSSAEMSQNSKPNKKEEEEL